jgi:hypothetical protein
LIIGRIFSITVEEVPQVLHGGHFERDPLLLEARPSISRTEGPVRNLLLAKVHCDRHVTEDSGIAFGTPEDTAIDPVD